MGIPPMFSHQRITAEFSAKSRKVVDTSDPGTGKTRATLEGWMLRRRTGGARRLLVVAPLSILEPSWGDDIRKFLPGISFATAIAPANKRRKAFGTGAEIILINTDGVVWVRENPEVLAGFTDICIDEFSAFKNRTTNRSRAANWLCKGFTNITILSGTPIQNTLTDLWHPIYMVDRGERLGSSFSKFRLDVCRPVQSGPRPEHIKWEDKEGADKEVAATLSDISIRHVFEECVDIPEQTERFVYVKLPPPVMKAYEEMRKESVLVTEEGTVAAVNAAVKVGKLLQIISGAVYDRDNNVVPISNERASVVMELVKERDHSIVAFTWQHEKEALLREAAKQKLTGAVIDGTVAIKKRYQIVKDYQDGKYQFLLCQPASAAHGLTLTRGRTTIWCSATPSGDQFKQLNRRIYRTGQTHKTETIMICAKGTREEEVYGILSEKLTRIDGLLALMAGS